MLLISILIGFAIGGLLLKRKSINNKRVDYEYSLLKSQLDYELQVQRDTLKQNFEDRKRLFEESSRERERLFKQAELRFNFYYQTYWLKKKEFDLLTPDKKLSFVSDYVEYKMNFNKTTNKYEVDNGPMSFDMYVCNYKL